MSARIAGRGAARIALASIAALLMALPAVAGNDFHLSVVMQMLLGIVLALAYNMLLGQGGMLSFGHAIYYGFGGFCAVHLMRAIADGLPLPVPLLPLAGGLAGLALALLFGAVSVRRAGMSFAMISLGIGELVYIGAQMFPQFFGNDSGVSGDRVSGPRLPGFDLGPTWQVYYLVLAWAVSCIVLIHRYSRTPVGSISRAVHDNPERIEFLGYSSQRVRYITFAISGLFAGVAGGTYAIVYEIAAINSLGLAASANMMVMAYIGGIGVFWGPVIGAASITAMQLLLSETTSAWLMYYGLMFVLTVMFMPEGLSGLITAHRGMLRRDVVRDLGLPYAKAIGAALLIAAGAVGLIEAGYLVAAARAVTRASNTLNLFGLRVMPTSPWYLGGCLVLAGIGVALGRRVMPAAGHAYDAARRRLAGKPGLRP